MREGFYRVDFIGMQGWGMALIALDTGQVVGADTEGGVFDGTYSHNPQTGLIETRSTFTATQAVNLVQGVALKPGDQFSISVDFPANASNTPVTAQTNFGPVQVSMSFIRNFPD